MERSSVMSRFEPGESQTLLSPAAVDRPWWNLGWPWWRQNWFIPTILEALLIGGVFWGLGDWRENQRAERAEQLEDQRADRADRLEDQRAVRSPARA